MTVGHAGTEWHSTSEQRIRSEHARKRACSAHAHSRARRATTGLSAARHALARQGTAIGAKAVALTPDVDLNAPLRVTTTVIKGALGAEPHDEARSGSTSDGAAVPTSPSPPRASSRSWLLDAIGLPLRTAQGLHAVAGAVLRIPALADSVGDLNAELVGLRADLSGMPADSRRLADDVEVVHDVLRVLNGELADVKASVAPVHGDLARVEAGLKPLPDKLDLLLPKVDELGEQLDHMRGELSQQLNGLRTDLSGLPFVSKSS